MFVPQASRFWSWINEFGSDHLLQPGPVHRLVLLVAPKQSPAQQSGLRVGISGWNCVALHTFLWKKVWRLTVWNILGQDLFKNVYSCIQLRTQFTSVHTDNGLSFPAHFQQINLQLTVEMKVNEKFKLHPVQFHNTTPLLQKYMQSKAVEANSLFCPSPLLNTALKKHLIIYGWIRFGLLHYYSQRDEAYWPSDN